MDNMKLWNAVCETDPDHTKKVNQRGGFTAIDAHYQIQSATEQFGPVGKGWGWDVEYKFVDKLVVALVTLWWTDKANTYGPVAGCADLTTNRVDTDAPKKAMTDGLTKALSYLGFNADVFLGKFDDNKYVQELKKKPEPKPEPKKKNLSASTLTAEEIKHLFAKAKEAGLKSKKELYDFMKKVHTAKLEDYKTIDKHFIISELTKKINELKEEK